MFGPASSVRLSKYSQPCQHKFPATKHPPLATWPHRQRRRAVSPSLRALTNGVTLANVFKAILRIHFCQQPISMFRVVAGGHSLPSIVEVKYDGATPLLPSRFHSFFPSPCVSLSSCSNSWAFTVSRRRRSHQDAGKTLTLKPTLLFTT